MTPTPTPSPTLIQILNSGEDDWLTTIFPFVTLVIGAGITYFFSSLSEKRRMKREDEQRWDSELLARADRVVVATDRLWEENSNYQHAVNRFVNDESNGDGANEAGEKATDAMREFTAARSALAIVAPEKVVLASIELGRAYSKVSVKSEARPAPSPSPEPESLAAFMDEVRKAAGISFFVKRKVAK